MLADPKYLADAPCAVLALVRCDNSMHGRSRTVYNHIWNDDHMEYINTTLSSYHDLSCISVLQAGRVQYSIMIQEDNALLLHFK